MKLPLIIVCILASFLFLGWVGLRIKPKPFPPFPGETLALQTVPLPEGLPAPVEYFYRSRYGENIPVFDTAVISGRGTLKLGGIALPIRFRFVHEAGKNFRSDIDMTIFGLPVMHAFEVYADGHGRGVTPGGVDENEAWFDQSANIRMWAEAIDWFPAILLTDPNVRWEPIDENTALLVVPFGETHDSLIVRFNPSDSSVQFIEAMKYKTADAKVLWINGIWMDDGRPWITMNVEEMLFNVDIGDYIREQNP
ncbi:MAG TPA: DUF6544 family protein [Anaerolineales bacterium]|nr:DUF6544 family protein [Anaerolineales bacterium]